MGVGGGAGSEGSGSQRPADFKRETSESESTVPYWTEIATGS